MQMLYPQHSAATVTQACLYLLATLRNAPHSTDTLKASADVLQTQHDAFQEACTDLQQAMYALIPLRVNVSFAELAADQALRLLVRAIEDHDNGKKGPAMAFILPDGLTPVLQLKGARQVSALQHLTDRLQVYTPRWDGSGHTDRGTSAPQQRTLLDAAATTLHDALEKRDAATHAVSNKRVVRDIRKDALITTYIKIAGEVKAAFPRNRELQEIFFDTLRDRSKPREEQEREEQEREEQD